MLFSLRKLEPKRKVQKKKETVPDAEVKLISVKASSQKEGKSDVARKPMREECVGGRGEASN